MLFWIFVTIFVIGIICRIILDKNTVWPTSPIDTEQLCDNLGVACLLIGIVTTFISVIILCLAYIGVDGDIAEYHARYASLTYQYENDFYDNDNDLGKKELVSEIQDWNERLARHKALQKNFWVGIFIPNIYDQFEFIELE